ncbi:MAG: histidinol dehydrogenase [Alphaproteobacteria bacterium]
MQKIIISKKLNNSQNFEWQNFIKKINAENVEISNKIQEIITAVKENKDKAVIDFTNKFDGTKAKKISDLILEKNTIKNSEKLVSAEIKDSLKLAMKRIVSYHQKQLPKDFNYTDKSGVKLGNIWKPIEKIGVYVPGGTASYPSSFLMSVLPAKCAGVKEISIFAPSQNGEINPAILYCAKICEIEKIHLIGGAQAIASMAYGTESITRVDKIVGPGNSYVAMAKKMLYGEVGIDMIAGPTDITIIADETANAKWVAIDSLSQLEHGADSKAFIITNSNDFANEIIANINQIAPTLKRFEIIKKSLKNSAIFVIKDIAEASVIANYIAPEHLEICTKNSKKILSAINNAGAIFLGNYTPEAIGDYMAGPSHTLPTSQTAKFASGLSVYDFLKRISLISCDQKSFKKISKATSILAKCEGLDAHQLSIDIRQ